MTKKRRNGGRSCHGRGHTHMVDCAHCGCKPQKDKAVRRFIVRNLVDGGTMNDLKAASAYEVYTMPKFYTKNYYCISCAVHSRVVHVRSAEDRKVRENPRARAPRVQSSEGQKPAAPKARAA